MKTKRILAILLAVMFIMGTFPMAALATSDTEDHEGDGGMLLPTTSFTQIREATLPTSAGFKFVLDPQGLYYLSNDQIKALVVEPGGDRLGENAVTSACTEADCEEHGDGDGSGDCNEVTGWKLLKSAGQMIFSEYAPYFINNSNYDVALDITFSFDDDDAGGTVATAATPATVDADDDPRVFIGATFSSANIKTAPTAFSGDVTLPILHADAKPQFLLGAANYDDETTITRDPDTPTGIIQSIDVEQRKIKAAGDTGNGTQFTLSGICNQKADWKGIDPTDLSIDITFNLVAPSATEWEFASTEYTGNPVAGAYGLIEGNTLTATSFITWTPLGIGPATPTAGFIVGGDIVPTRAPMTVARNTWLAIPFDAGGATPTLAVTAGATTTDLVYEAATKQIAVRWTTAAWRTITITVGGTTFTVDVQVT